MPCLKTTLLFRVSYKSAASRSSSLRSTTTLTSTACCIYSHKKRSSLRVSKTCWPSFWLEIACSGLICGKKTTKRGIPWPSLSRATTSTLFRSCHSLMRVLIKTSATSLISHLTSLTKYLSTNSSLKSRLSTPVRSANNSLKARYHTSSSWLPSSRPSRQILRWGSQEVQKTLSSF